MRPAISRRASIGRQNLPLPSSGLLWLWPKIQVWARSATFATSSKSSRPKPVESLSADPWLHRQGQQAAGSLVDLKPVARIANTAGQSSQGVDQGENCEPTLSQVDRFAGHLGVDATASKSLEDLVGVVAKLGPHRLVDRPAETVPTLVAPGDQVTGDSLDLDQRVADVGRVLSLELDHFHGIPDQVILANRLKPEGLDAKRTPTDFRIPQKETGRPDRECRRPGRRRYRNRPAIRFRLRSRIPGRAGG